MSPITLDCSCTGQHLLWRCAGYFFHRYQADSAAKATGKS